MAFTSVSRCWPGKKWGNGATPESTGKKGDHLIGDYYVAFDQHYRAELAELTAKFKAQGLNDEEAEKRAKKNRHS